MGILRFITDRGAFPRVDEPIPASRAEAKALASCLDCWENCQSAEDAPDVCTTILDRMVQQRWAWFFRDQAEAMHHLYTTHIVLNRLVLITKARGDGTTKHRLVWDLLRSGVNALVRQGERIVLPRVSDVIDDLAELQVGLSPSEEL